MSAVRDRLPRFGCLALVMLVACTLVFDAVHGIRLGEDRVAFHGIYRLRQSLAIAISRLHDPSPGGYLAYKSVVNSLNENGFAIFPGEPGSHLDINGWEALLKYGPRLDRAIAQARDVTIDPNLPPETIQGNELGLADYMYWSFRLFGDRISSLYDFYFLIVAAACLLFVLQFKHSPFLLFLLVVFLAELFFLENYADIYGSQLQTITNSRLFSGLSLLPAIHILLVLWQRLPPRAWTIAGVLAQSLIFAFLLSCRTEAGWQAAMIAVVAAGVSISSWLRLRSNKQPYQINQFIVSLWPGAVCLAVIAIYSAGMSAVTDERYRTEPGGHVIWHEVLLGLFDSSPELRREYIGEPVPAGQDQRVHVAIIRDLKARNDFSSPIVRKLSDGDVTLDILAGYGEYERLARSLALRIIVSHPLAVLAGVSWKIADQRAAYDNPRRHTMAWGSLRIPVALICLGALICALAGGFTIDFAALGSAAVLIVIVLLFASVTPMIESSPLSIGSLFCYLGVVAIVVPWLVVIMVQGLAGLKARLWGPRLGANSA